MLLDFGLPEEPQEAWGEHANNPKGTRNVHVYVKLFCVPIVKITIQITFN